jgi:hypothetical protein
MALPRMRIAMNRHSLRWLLFLHLTVGLVACGGGDAGTPSFTYDQLREQAAVQEAEARRTGVDAPCATTEQCSVLNFSSTVPTCQPNLYKAYSRVSATATQAGSAAAEQRRLAAQALLLAPNNDLVCIAIFLMPPTAACVNNVCGLSP